MLHHIELYVGDLERSVAFWTPLMQLLGYEAERWSGGMNYLRGATDTSDPYFCLLQAPAAHAAAGYHRQRIGLNHLAFRVPTPAEVDAVTAWLAQRGQAPLYADRHPYAGGPGYYAVFFEDPDRIKLEVVATQAPAEPNPKVSP